LLASAKKPASAKKHGAKTAPPAEAEPAPELAELQELPAEEDPTIPAITTTPAVELDIPQEMRNQPVSLFGNMLAPEVASAEPSVENEFVIETSSGEPFTPGIEPDSQLGAETEQPLETMLEPSLSAMDLEADEPEPTGINRLFAAAGAVATEETPFREEPEMTIPTVSGEESASTPPEPSWTADPVEVMEEDRKLCGPGQPDWQGLVSMVQEEDLQGQFPAASFAGAGSTVKSPVAPNPPESPEPPPPPEEPQASPNLEAAEEPSPAVPAQTEPPEPPEAPLSTDTIEMMAPQLAPLDYATVEQIVRETIEEVMPQIVDRISQATGLRFQKNEPKDK
jgi:hypothetical protein